MTYIDGFIIYYRYSVGVHYVYVISYMGLLMLKIENNYLVDTPHIILKNYLNTLSLIRLVSNNIEIPL